MSKTLQLEPTASGGWKVTVKCSAEIASVDEVADAVQQIRAELKTVARRSQGVKKISPIPPRRQRKDSCSSVNTSTPPLKKRETAKTNRLKGYLRFVQERKNQQKGEVLDWNEFQKRASEEWKQPSSLLP